MPAFGMSQPSGFSDPRIEAAYGGVFSDDELAYGRQSMPPQISKAARNFE